MKFHEKLLKLRKQKGISQEYLAEKIGISRQAIAKWETGQATPEIENLIPLSDFFMVSVDRLIRDLTDENCTANNKTGEEEEGNKTSDHIIPFLIKAKRKCYAGKGAETLSSRTNSHDLQYIENDLTYIDSYLGGECFAGEEAVWLSDKPVWAMNYAGRVIGEGFSGDFLKEVLYQVPEDYPYRGPFLYHKGDYTYHCTVSGVFEWYSGYEEIFCGDRKIYECIFHGGSLK